ncbi:MAG: pyruvate carboxylase [Oscillospiraceae bacterium]|nr:pyruvate carboxylase [Oscillospiraceae bacterium]
MKKIEKVLAANRGEIAIRIFRACHDMGLATVAVYSKEDKYTLFRSKADEAYKLDEKQSPLGAYLDIPNIVRIAKENGVDAIHPGYGFLSENTNFAKACEDAGIIFIGPPSDVLGKMGDKLNAKKVAIEAGVPIIQGTKEPLSSVEEAKECAEKFGLPVILKAAAGGGGRGMRLIEKSEEIENAFHMVQSEAEKAFGSADVFMEKYLVEPKHIEVQILADNHGNIVHLFERDCTVQRRYQKVVEIAPALVLTDQKRAQIHSDAVKIAKAVGYINAGTVEFLVDKEGNHYFIEMNPRIQVEHTVTEMVTGIDIVQAQINIARGHKLSDPVINIPSQESVTMSGCSIQCRVTTEDPANNFAPDNGRITAYRDSGGFGVRFDAGNAFTGSVITPFYDSLLAKVITTDRTFEGAVRKMLRTLGEIRIRGVKTNIPFLNNILTHDTFIAGKCYTKFIDETPELFELTNSKDRATKVMKYIAKTTLTNPSSESKPSFAAAPIPEYDGAIADGIKQILDREGPEKLSKWVLNQKKLLITDTTMRDAQQSLLATRLRTRDMLAAAPATARILGGCFSLEMWGGATFDTAYRFLTESPWERLDQLRREIPNIPFQMLFRGANAVGYSCYPDNVIKEFIKESAASGIDIFRIFDSLNWLPNMELAIEEVAKSGKVANAVVCYTGNVLESDRDKYDLKYYVDFAKELEKRGAHILTIKDMSGLLRPYAAKKLVAALKDSVDLPIHLHTHDTSGNQIAAYMMASEAGVDIVDTAISSMSCLTSQPSMESLVAALEGTERETGFDLAELQKLNEYWAAVRQYYSQFEGDIRTPAAEIYKLEIPGGQYTNLKSQVDNFGLGDRFDETKKKYIEVNSILGDIVKVTPSSKMVGDMAIFMVQNELTADNIVEKGASLTFPDSVVSYFKGMMGQPSFGFPKDLQRVVLKGEAPVTTRPGAGLAPIDMDKVCENLKEFTPNPSMRDAISHSLYPKVVEEYFGRLDGQGDLSRMDSHVFFMGMKTNEETEVAIEDGKTLIVKYLGPGQEYDDGTRQMHYELNGSRREVVVEDKSIQIVAEQVRYADTDNLCHVGSSIPGSVSKIFVKKGDEVTENQPLFIIEAMKMETSVVARTGGVVSDILVSAGQLVKAGELLAELK